MGIEFLCDVFQQHAADEAVVWKDEPYTYGWLLEQLDQWRARLDKEQIEPGTVTMLEADCSPSAVALFLALAERGCILVPLTEAVQGKRDEFIEIAEGEVTVQIDSDDNATVRRFDRKAALGIEQLWKLGGEELLELIDRHHDGIRLLRECYSGRGPPDLGPAALGRDDKYRDRLITEA